MDEVSVMLRGGANGVTTVFVWMTVPIANSPFAGQEVAEYTAGAAANDPLRKYVYSGAYIDELLMLVDRTAAGSVGAGSDEKFYYHQNNLYSVAALTDQSGAVVERYAYTAYGEPTFCDAAGTPLATQASTVGNDTLYTGRRLDPETKLFYYRARMYSPRLGRFISRDPIAADMHLYRYCTDSPLSYTDPTGLRQVCGFYVWLYTGLGLCVDESVWDAAMNGAAGVVTCWWDCERSIHKCPCCAVADTAGAACTLAFTHVEIAKGEVRQGLGNPGDVTTLQSALALRLAQMGYKGTVQQLLRCGDQHVSVRVVSSGCTSAVAGVSAVEFAISAYCGWKCSK